ncbi:hypothetical protein CE91St38_10000 [Desulfovibrionaceae bacterium]|nr:hypothetical protein CE91St38_10000 [Desulfovibrionaceae bacterium]GKI11544.1 hypothetical protein CE91St39_09980 [Desulfovibrionaceae bacterium]
MAVALDVDAQHIPGAGPELAVEDKIRRGIERFGKASGRAQRAGRLPGIASGAGLKLEQSEQKQAERRPKRSMRMRQTRRAGGGHG